MQLIDVLTQGYLLQVDSIKKISNPTVWSLPLVLVATITSSIQAFADVRYEPVVEESNYNRDISSFVTWLKASVAEETIPGIAMAIVDRDSVLLEETWG